MSDKIVRMEKELELLRAEAAFQEKKAAGELTDAEKLALRELRQNFRLNYRKAKPGAQPGTLNVAAGRKASVS